MTVRAAFRVQGEACAALGSPFMGQLMSLIGERLSEGAVAEHVLNWPGDPSVSADSVPLRLAGALHALRLQELAFSRVYPPHEVGDDTLWAAIEQAFHEHEAHILKWLELPPQTNEVRRSAVLAAALSIIAERHSDPVDLMELGCSAGLNLRADHFSVKLGGVSFGPEGSPVRLEPEWSGPEPTTEPLPIVGRSGVDLAPIDAQTAEGRLRLLSYLWPDQRHRIDLTEAAIGIAKTVPARITAGDAGEWLERVLAEPAPGRTRVIFHTVAWQYFPEATKTRALHAMKSASGPVVRFAMETDGGRGARLTLTQYPSCDIQELGRADFHGQWIDWTG